MAKSEINLLQELLVKQGVVPTYDFIDTKTNPNSAQFTCIVSCKQFKANGTGYTKKEAKHNAAKNMLSLLVINNNITLPADTLSSSNANILQSPASAYETHLSHAEQTTVNYVGLLQEFCQQRKISMKDIVYEVVSDEGLPHMKTFTVEVRIGLLHERGMAHCKKSAKQIAAKKLLLHLNPNAANLNMAEKKISTNTDVLNKVDIDKKLEDDIQKLGTRILDCVDKKTLPVAKLTEKAKSLYLECKSERSWTNRTTNSLKDLHMLFEKNYANKIPHSMREKMKITMDKYTNRPDLMHEIRRDIEGLLKVKIEQFAVCSTQKNMICLRLLSNPCIVQFGIGETKIIAESNAMYNLVQAILIFLNVECLNV